MITIARGNDWIGLYDDGRLVTQGHNLILDNMLRHFGHEVKSIDVDQEWLEDRGDLPDNLAEVKED